MEDINEQIKKLQDALHILLKQHKQQKKENELLKIEIESLKKNLMEKNNFIENTEQKTAAENIVLHQSYYDKKQLQQKIDIYLKDIEHCLSLLNA